MRSRVPKEEKIGEIELVRDLYCSVSSLATHTRMHTRLPTDAAMWASRERAGPFVCQGTLCRYEVTHRRPVREKIDMI